MIETVNSQNRANHVIGFDVSFQSMIWPKESLTRYLKLEKTVNTFLTSSSIWPNFLFNKVRKYLGPYFTAEDFRIQVRGPPTNYVYVCHVATVTLGYVSYQKGIIQGHPAPRPVLQDRFVNIKVPSHQ